MADANDSVSEVNSEQANLNMDKNSLPEDGDKESETSKEDTIFKSNQNTKDGGVKEQKSPVSDLQVANELISGNGACDGGNDDDDANRLDDAGEKVNTKSMEDCTVEEGGAKKRDDDTENSFSRVKSPEHDQVDVSKENSSPVLSDDNEEEASSQGKIDVDKKQEDVQETEISASPSAACLRSEKEMENSKMNSSMLMDNVEDDSEKEHEQMQASDMPVEQEENSPADNKINIKDEDLSSSVKDSDANDSPATNKTEDVTDSADSNEKILQDDTETRPESPLQEKDKDLTTEDSLVQKVTVLSSDSAETKQSEGDGSGAVDPAILETEGSKTEHLGVMDENNAETEHSKTKQTEEYAADSIDRDDPGTEESETKQSENVASAAMDVDDPGTEDSKSKQPEEDVSDAIDTDDSKMDKSESKQHEDDVSGKDDAESGLCEKSQDDLPIGIDQNSEKVHSEDPGGDIKVLEGNDNHSSEVQSDPAFGEKISGVDETAEVMLLDEQNQTSSEAKPEKEKETVSHEEVEKEGKVADDEVLLLTNENKTPDSDEASLTVANKNEGDENDDVILTEGEDSQQSSELSDKKKVEDVVEIIESDDSDDDTNKSQLKSQEEPMETDGVYEAANEKSSKSEDSSLKSDKEAEKSHAGDSSKGDVANTDSSLATMDSSNDMGIQISSVTSGADVPDIQIASVVGGAEMLPDSKDSEKKEETTQKTSRQNKESKENNEDTAAVPCKIKQEPVSPPAVAKQLHISTSAKPSGSTHSASSPAQGTKPSQSKPPPKAQTCIVCQKVGRCKYNIVRNGDIKHLCDDICFRRFRANPTMFLKGTVTAPKPAAPTHTHQPLTRSQTGSLKSPQSNNNQSSASSYKICAVCQLMNINTQKPFANWQGLDFCGEMCLNKFQANLNTSCSYCTAFIPVSNRVSFCMKVGSEVRPFCSNKCYQEYKKHLRLCAYCHKDLSTVPDSFSAPIGPHTFRDFCSKMCMKKFEQQNSEVEIIGVETGKSKPASNQKCAVCHKTGTLKHNIKLNGVLNRLCSDPCLSAFQYANKLAMNTCDNCGGLCPTEETVSHFIQFEGQQKRFCKDACVNTFRAINRKTVSCAWCGAKKPNFDMIERVDSNNKYQLFCSLNCLSLYRVNLQAKSNQAVTCDHCHKYVPAQYHLTMSDASVRNFCSYNCVMSFQSQFGANSNKGPSEPRIHSQPTRVQLQQKPNTRATASQNTQSQQSSSGSFPIISNVVSLAPQGSQKQQTVNIKSSTHVPVVVSGQSQSVRYGPKTVTTSTSTTQQQIIIQPPPPKQMKNKSLLCKPFVQTKATSCRPHTQTKEVQTDEVEGKPVLIPVPVPVYVPTPLAMYAAPTPQMVPIPIPIPVPVFIPTTKKSADKILRQIKEIREKIPSDPLEAEILMMAEAVAGGGGGDSDSESDRSDTENIPPVSKHEKTEEIEDENDAVDDKDKSGGEEDLVQMALRMAEEITGPVLDLETSVEPVAVNTEPPTPPPAPVRIPDDEEDEYTPPRETRSRRGKRSARGRGGRPSKRAKMEITEPEPEPESSPPAPAPAPQPPPDANMHLKYTYGVNAWRHWVVHKNTLLERVSKRGSGKLKLFKTDLLQCTADELNYSLCLFVKEVRKPNGEEYSPDSIYYLCLGIQQYLYENSRIDNIFTDLYYEKFTECLNDVLGKYEPRVNASGQMLCRIEEEHLWECKQLGAHSPYVLLNTLIYFNTKHFMLKTAEEHMKLSFAHILKHWKKGGPGSISSKAGSNQGRSVSLRYYCLNPASGQGTPTHKKPKEGIPVYETSENLENPLRCPVKLYEFYLSKCSFSSSPESIKNRNDMFYLIPERSCVPDSPVWYSTQSISTEAMMKMLSRILLVREIQEAHLHAQPIYV